MPIVLASRLQDLTFALESGMARHVSQPNTSKPSRLLKAKACVPSNSSLDLATKASRKSSSYTNYPKMYSQHIDVHLPHHVHNNLLRTIRLRGGLHIAVTFMPNLSIATNEVAIILFIWEIVSRAPRGENIGFCINWVGGVIRRCGLRGILGLFFLSLRYTRLTCDSNQTYVAIKISISEPNSKSPNRESTVLQTLATAAHANQPGCQYLMTMKDFFEISGPNGRHECLVLELLGPSVADYLDAHSLDERLPGELAKRVVKQTLLGLAFLHERGIAHGGMFMLQYPSFPFIC